MNDFLNYVVVRTPSDEHSTTSPSSQCQFDLARILADEMTALGISDVSLDEFCYVYGKIPATPGYENKPSIGFIDTWIPFPITVTMTSSRSYTRTTMAVDLPLYKWTYPYRKRFPASSISLPDAPLITTDGTTVLGADDKAGVAEIMTMAEALIKENIPHGPISIAFTPDEEVGGGTDHFNVEKFAAQFAYTLDGDTEGEIQYENFNACKADFEITGFAVHPGSSKDTMINACLVAAEINNMLPGLETPRETEDYEGFYHLTGMSGDVAQAKLHYIVRDHDKNLFEARKETSSPYRKNLNEKWGEGTVKLTITDQYQNMAEIIAGCMHLIENAKKACENAGVAPLVLPIRGGTDGCQLSFMGLPCPNLWNRGHAFHGPYEHITAEGMDKGCGYRS